MTLTIVVVGTLLMVAAAIFAFVSPVKFAVGLLGTGLLVVVTFATLSFTGSGGGSGPMGGFSHDQLEADRVMTQQMATVVGPGMEALMTTNGMLERSANGAYLRALEQHSYEVDRMLERAP